MSQGGRPKGSKNSQERAPPKQKSSRECYELYQAALAREKRARLAFFSKASGEQSSSSSSCSSCSSSCSSSSSCSCSCSISCSSSNSNSNSNGNSNSNSNHVDNYDDNDTIQQCSNSNSNGNSNSNSNHVDNYDDNDTIQQCAGNDSILDIDRSHIMRNHLELDIERDPIVADLNPDEDEDGDDQNGIMQLYILKIHERLQYEFSDRKELKKNFQFTFGTITPIC